MIIYDISQPLVPTPFTVTVSNQMKIFYFKMFPQKTECDWFFLYYSSFHILVILNFQINHKYAYCGVYMYMLGYIEPSEICRRDTGNGGVEEMKILFEQIPCCRNYCAVCIKYSVKCGMESGLSESCWCNLAVRRDVIVMRLLYILHERKLQKSFFILHVNARLV